MNINIDESLCIENIFFRPYFIEYKLVRNFIQTLILLIFHFFLNLSFNFKKKTLEIYRFFFELWIINNIAFHIWFNRTNFYHQQSDCLITIWRQLNWFRIDDEWNCFGTNEICRHYTEWRQCGIFHYIAEKSLSQKVTVSVTVLHCDPWQRTIHVYSVYK